MSDSDLPIPDEGILLTRQTLDPLRQRVRPQPVGVAFHGCQLRVCQSNFFRRGHTSRRCSPARE
jgi:hypothetical protein